MTEKFLPWDPDPSKRPTGPMRWYKQADGATKLQVYCWGAYTPEHIASFISHTETGEFNWFDLPVEEEE